MKLHTRITGEVLKENGFSMSEATENYLLDFEEGECDTEGKVEIVIGDKVIKLVNLYSEVYPNFDVQLNDWEDELEGVVDFTKQAQPESGKYEKLVLSTKDKDMQQTYDVLDGVIDGKIYFKKNLSQSITVTANLEKDKVNFVIRYDADAQTVTIEQLKVVGVGDGQRKYLFSHIGFGCFPLLPV